MTFHLNGRDKIIGTRSQDQTVPGDFFTAGQSDGTVLFIDGCHLALNGAHTLVGVKVTLRHEKLVCRQFTDGVMYDLGPHVCIGMLFPDNRNVKFFAAFQDFLQGAVAGNAVSGDNELFHVLHSSDGSDGVERAKPIIYANFTTLEPVH
ncbi:hypothetical protein DSECCO2_234530 [anaerobic digester metagenome]